MKALGRSSGGRCGALVWVVVVSALAVGAGFLPAAGVARPAAGKPLAVAATQAGRAPAVKVLWGRKVALKPYPQPGRRTRTTSNVVILERAGDHYREVVRPRNVRVTCAVTYTRGGGNVVKRLEVPGAWRSDVYAYDGDGEVTCGPWTVPKGALGLWQNVTGLLVFRGATHRGPVVRLQIHRRTRSEPPSVPASVSFLPRTKPGSIYPTLGTVPFAAPVADLWRSFGKPPQSTCSASQVLVCNWRTAVDEVHVSGSGMETYAGLKGGVVPFTRVLVETKDLSRSKLHGWTTPDGIHIGSRVADVKRLASVSCGRHDCRIEQPRLHRAGDARYRFNVAFTLDGRVSRAASRVVGIDVTQIDREEGACSVNIGFDPPKVFQLNASCSGELTAARLEPLNGSTRLGARRDYEEWSIRPYEDDGSVAHVSSNGSQSLVRSGLVGGAYRWSVGCEEPQVPIPVYCAPGRGDGTPAWQHGLLESWNLEFHGTSTVAIIDDGRKIPPLRFVAEFRDREPFVYILRYAS